MTDDNAHPVSDFLLRDDEKFDKLFYEFSPDEVDNVLTALNTLTSLSPGLFPPSNTFAGPDYQMGIDGPSGARFVVYEGGVEVRMIRLPREDLMAVTNAVEAVLIMSSIVASQAA